MTVRRERVAELDAAAKRLVDAGQRVSRRTLRAAGVHGSNADLGTLARIIRSQSVPAGTTADRALMLGSLGGLLPTLAISIYRHLP
jgi:hypothetical protein